MAQLEQWARDQKIEDTGSRVIDTLLPIIQVGDNVYNLYCLQMDSIIFLVYLQATQLLQARKSEEDVIGICDM